MTHAVEQREYRAELPVSLIDDPMIDARIDRDESKLDELARDLLKRGMIFPVAVVRVDRRFELIDGARRILAAQRAGLVVVPAFIYPTKELALEGIKYAANAFREDMSPADEAHYFSELLKGECAGDIQRVAALCNKTENYVNGRLELFSGFPSVFEAVRERKIGLGVAAELNKLPDENYLPYYLENAVKTGATVSTVQGWIQEFKQIFGKQPAAPAAPEQPEQPGAAATVDPTVCIVCGKSDHAYNMRHVPLHTHCRMAILDPLLRGAAGDGN